MAPIPETPVTLARADYPVFRCILRNQLRLSGLFQSESGVTGFELVLS